VLKNTAEMFRETMLNWIVDSDLPFSVVQNPHFRSLLMQLNAEKVASLLPESGSTVRKSAVEITKLKRKRRLRCFGHILNLVAKAFLEGSNKNNPLNARGEFSSPP
jgi:hypothetical protein